MRSPADMIADLEERRRRDKERWAALDDDQCQLCHAEGPDMRSTFFGCLYAVEEAVPEVIDLWEVREDELRRLYYLRICKTCRGDLLGRMAEWRNEAIARRELPKDADGCPEADPEQNIPVRINGAVKMLTAGEYEVYRAEREKKG